MKYKDRTHAGSILAQKLSGLDKHKCVVLALPNGGIPVGLKIAEENGFDFDLLFVSKITPSFNSEIGYGAVSESGEITLNSEFIKHFSINEKTIDRDTDKTRGKINNRMQIYLKGRTRVSLKGKIAIIADDGIASGYTIRSAIKTARIKGADKILIAVPTCPGSKFDDFKKIEQNEHVESIEKIICPDVRYIRNFAVADAYENWCDISDNQALNLLNESKVF